MHTPLEDFLNWYCSYRVKKGRPPCYSLVLEKIYDELLDQEMKCIADAFDGGASRITPIEGEQYFIEKYKSC